jgi:hypothetical protein
MTTAAPAPAPVKPDTGAGDELEHVYCKCNRDIGLCGIDISGHQFVAGWSDDVDPCVVCWEMEDKPCPQCGEIP